MRYFCAKGITVSYNGQVFVLIKACAILMIIYSCSIRVAHQNVHVKCWSTHGAKTHTHTQTTTVCFLILLFKLCTEIFVMTLHHWNACASLSDPFTPSDFTRVSVCLSVCNTHKNPDILLFCCRCE